ncbi:hypothetical protein ACVWXU_002682 [Streptomyces sp. TE33382]
MSTGCRGCGGGFAVGRHMGSFCPPSGRPHPPPLGAGGLMAGMCASAGRQWDVSGTAGRGRKLWVDQVPGVGIDHHWP